MSLQERNIKRVQDLVGEYMKGNAAGYLDGCADDFKGSVLGGLIPGADKIACKGDFIKVMESMDQYLEVKKFEPSTWRAVGDDVFFVVDWELVWKATGKEVRTKALVRKVLRDNMICEKYHMICVEDVTGSAAPVHDDAPVKRVQELLAEYMKGNAAGYLAGCADDFKGSIFGGVLPGGESIESKAQFEGLMGTMEKHLEVKKFEPANFRACPDGSMLFTVDWTLVLKESGKEVDHTAIVRKVVRDNKICEKWHLVDAAELTAEPTPRDVIGTPA